MRDWLRESEGNPIDVEVCHLEKNAGSSGQYEFDVVARFTRFQGAEFTVLVECKRYLNAVERELVLALQAKLLDVNGQKAMMFSTGGFQKGAIEYASEYNIALITLNPDYSRSRVSLMNRGKVIWSGWDRYARCKQPFWRTHRNLKDKSYSSYITLEICRSARSPHAHSVFLALPHGSLDRSLADHQNQGVDHICWICSHCWDDRS